MMFYAGHYFVPAILLPLRFSNIKTLHLPDPQTYHEQELLQRIAGGDEAAFHWLFKRYYASLVLYGEKFDLSREDA